MKRWYLRASGDDYDIEDDRCRAENRQQALDWYQNEYQEEGFSEESAEEFDLREMGEFYPNGIRPVCCDQARHALKDRWVQRSGQAEENHSTVMRFHYDMTAVGEEYSDPPGWFFQGYPIKFCPFCGQNPGEVVRNPTPPEPICRITDGGYYCDTCKERLRGCFCNPPSCLFVVKSEANIDHSDHGCGTYEDGPDDKDCICRGSHFEEECAGTGCGFCSQNTSYTS